MIDVSIIVPARNEAQRLTPLLESIVKQTVRPAEVIVVDDCSSDRTLDIVREYAAYGVKAESLDGPATGWQGKSRACWIGARRSTGGVLLFLDADVILLPDAIERLLALHRETGGVVSVQPYHRMTKSYEQLSAVCNIAVMAGTGAFTPAARANKQVRSSGGGIGRKSPQRGMFGPCILLSRDDYFNAGGHEAVKGALVEDVALSLVFDDAGVRVHCFGGKGCVEFRMYPLGLRDLVEGWTKNLATASAHMSMRGVLPLFLWIMGIVMSLFAWVMLAPAAFPPAVPAVLFIWLMCAVQFHVIARRVGNFSPVAAALHHGFVLFFLFLFFRSAYDTHVKRSVRWKGRRIDL